MNKNDSNNTSRTNWKALAEMSDDTIDYSDIPPLTDEFFDRATLRIPAAQAQNLVHLDPDVMTWFQSQGVQRTEMINNILRQYIENTPQQLDYLSKSSVR
jgi:uncharacterized protein (DUF4415 family)